MKAKDIMYTRVVTVRQTATLRELNEILQKRGVSSLPVVDEEGRVVGMVTEGDLIKAVLPSYMELHENSLYLHDFEYLEDRVHHVEEMPVKEDHDPEGYQCRRGHTNTADRLHFSPERSRPTSCHAGEQAGGHGGP